MRGKRDRIFHTILSDARQKMQVHEWADRAKIIQKSFPNKNRPPEKAACPSQLK
jgi:hypothetical protein